MTTVVVDGLLGMVVLGVWLGCAGFARLRAPLDRLHCVAFVNATAGLAFTVLGFVADGASTRALKILLITAVSLLGGAALSHATGRALLLRGARPDTDAGADAASGAGR